MSTHAPALRSVAGRQCADHAVAGKLVLQQCARCQAVQYPPREVCARCLADALEWRAQDGAGVLLTESALHHSLDPFFEDQLPFKLASVQLDCGPVVLAQLCAGSSPGARLRISHQRQPGGSWILQAGPEKSEAS